MDEFDLLVIGGGTGGYTAAIRAAQLGLKPALVEKSKIGGTCLHRGCIPTKAWLECSETLSRVRKAATFGIKASDIEFDFSAVVSHQHKVVDALHQGIVGAVKKKKIEIIEGEARFLSPTEVAVAGGEGERRLRARNVVVATGSQPKNIPGLAPDGGLIVTSDELLESKELPKSIVIVGAGAIGCEFATFFAQAGTEVTLIEVMPTVVPLEDADMGRALGKALEAMGVNVMTSARVLTDRVRTYDNTVELAVQHDGSEKTVRGERLLLAVGRAAVTEGLGLENTGVRVENGWIRVDETYRTDDPAVYAVGDAIGGLLLAHVAGAEGFIAAEAIAGNEPERLDYTRVPRVTYSKPQVAAVGLTEEEARQTGRNVKAQRFSFKYNAMALIEDETEGLAKVVYDQDSGDLLGVHILGPRASELIAEAALGRFLEASAWELGANIHPHPSLSETLGEAAQLSAGISIYW